MATASLGISAGRRRTLGSPGWPGAWRGGDKGKQNRHNRQLYARYSAGYLLSTLGSRAGVARTHRSVLTAQCSGFGAQGALRRRPRRVGTPPDSTRGVSAGSAWRRPAPPKVWFGGWRATAVGGMTRGRAGCSFVGRACIGICRREASASEEHNPAGRYNEDS
jgi:hypothetical protein